ncbi:MAG TPA: peptidoglycan-binding protein [Bacteroidales bacterium]|mgnify:CR=1 FL=1|nr:peptidoglycan-binding protein [Bacteroidales bacterium]
MAVKTYLYSTNLRLSSNFVTSEFRCKCGKAHSTLISTELVNGLQRLVDVLGASKAIITSGYRCFNHDKAVGGSGYGMHTRGLAADVIFYDKAGKPISSKLVSCKAQDLGFNGIGKIDSQAIHLDIGPRRWWGDETVLGGTTGSVTTDYYRYYGIKRSGHISELQTLLNAKGHKLAVDNIIGPKTLAAVKSYTIEQGDRGELVRWVQTRLKALGYDCGTADGIAGDKTMNAIHKWQSANGVGVGYFGGSDWNTLLK